MGPAHRGGVCKISRHRFGVSAFDWLTGGARSKARCASSALIAPSCSSKASPSPKSSCSALLPCSAAVGGKRQSGTRDLTISAIRVVIRCRLWFSGRARPTLQRSLSQPGQPVQAGRWALKPAITRSTTHTAVLPDLNSQRGVGFGEILLPTRNATLALISSGCVRAPADCSSGSVSGSCLSDNRRLRKTAARRLADDHPSGKSARPLFSGGVCICELRLKDVDGTRQT